MSKLHQGIQLDDKFSKAMLKVQKAIEDLEMLADDFRDLDHSPVASQLFQLDDAASRFKDLAGKMRGLKK